MTPDLARETSPRRAARYLFPVGFGSLSNSAAILRNESWNPFDDYWRNRWMTAAALAYPAAWLALVVLGFRALRKGWSRGRSAVLVVCLVAIPWLAVVLARDDWFFAAAAR